MERDVKALCSLQAMMCILIITRLSETSKEILFARCDAKNRIFRDCRISEGTLTNSLIHPRRRLRVQ